jgi:hypothetical protein
MRNRNRTRSTPIVIGLVFVVAMFECVKVFTLDYYANNDDKPDDKPEKQ